LRKANGLQLQVRPLENGNTFLECRKRYIRIGSFPHPRNRQRVVSSKGTGEGQRIVIYTVTTSHYIVGSYLISDSNLWSQQRVFD
jgi:hypothetical protein